MDDSQARGLAKRFIREYIENQDRLVAKLFNDKLKRKNRPHSEFIEFAKKNEHMFPNALLVGGKRQSMLFITMFDAGDYNHAQDFDEINLHNITFYSVLKYCAAGFNSNVRFTISLHCIQRIFQRLYRGKYNFKEASQTVISQFKWVGNWTAIWGLLNLQIFRSTDMKVDKVVIPAKDGLLLAVLADNTVIDIRTFVDDELLTVVQRSLKDVLTNIFIPLERVPLHFALEPEERLIRDDLSPPSIKAWLAIMQGYRRDFFLPSAGGLRRDSGDESTRNLQQPWRCQ